MASNSETASAPVGTEAASGKRSVPAFCRTCQLRHKPCGYYWQECAAMDEAEATRRHKDEVDAVAWALDRVFEPLERGGEEKEACE